MVTFIVTFQILISFIGLDPDWSSVPKNIKSIDPNCMKEDIVVSWINSKLYCLLVCKCIL